MSLKIEPHKLTYTVRVTKRTEVNGDMKNVQINGTANLT